MSETATMPAKRLATTEEVAEALQVAPRTVLRMAAAGEIPLAIDRVNLKRYDLEAVLAALASPKKGGDR